MTQADYALAEVVWRDASEGEDALFDPAAEHLSRDQAWTLLLRGVALAYDPWADAPDQNWIDLHCSHS